MGTNIYWKEQQKHPRESPGTPNVVSFLSHVERMIYIWAFKTCIEAYNLENLS